MQNKNNGNGSGIGTAFDPAKAPFLQAIPQGNSAKELVSMDHFEDFIVMLDWKNEAQAQFWTECYNKCVKYRMKEQLREYMFDALAKCAVGARRAQLYAMANSGVMVDSYFKQAQEVEKKMKKDKL